MPKYAEGTIVSVEKTMGEIPRLIKAHGCDAYQLTQDGNANTIQFRRQGRIYKIAMSTPRFEDFAHLPGKPWHDRTAKSQLAAHDAECRRRWRALLLILKAKFAGAEDGIVSFEQEFAGYLKLPSGETVAEWIEPQVRVLQETNMMPRGLLPQNDHLALPSA